MGGHLIRASIWAIAAALAIASGTAADAQGVLISNLNDIAFGTLPTTGVDQVKSQSVCAFSGILGGRYSVTATGSGSGGAFAITSGGGAIPYEVQWNGSLSGQTSGTNLTSGTALGGQTMALSCPIVGATDASLIVVIRGSEIVKATAGNYNGTLTIILSAN